MVKANNALSNSALVFISLTANWLFPCWVPETLHARFLVSVKPLMALAFRLTPKHSITLNCCMWYSGKDWLHDWWRLQNVAINSKVIFVREIINKPHHEQQRIYSIESGGLFHPILLTHPYTLKEKVKKKMGVRMKGTLGGCLPFISILELRNIQL